MKRTALVGVCAAVAVLALITSAWRAAPRPHESGQAIGWPELIPPGWTPVAGGAQLAALRDDSPAGRARWEELQQAWANAPLRQTLDGAEVRISGYAVPLDGGADGLREMLLVPYLGACIHTPPPPANQIVHVKTRLPVKGVRSMDTVWVAGVLAYVRNDSYMGTSSWSLPAADVQPYGDGLKAEPLR
jgi:uncharacterized protein